MDTCYKTGAMPRILIYLRANSTAQRPITKLAREIIIIIIKVKKGKVVPVLN
jgi:hypothetical protein